MYQSIEIKENFFNFQGQTVFLETLNFFFELVY